MRGPREGLKALIFAENVLYSFHTMNNTPRPAPRPGAYFFGEFPRNRHKEARIPRESSGRENSSSSEEECGRHGPEDKNLLPREPEALTISACADPSPGQRGEARASAQAGGGRSSSFGNEYEEDHATAGLQDPRIHRLPGARRWPDCSDRGARGRRCAARAVRHQFRQGQNDVAGADCESSVGR